MVKVVQESLLSRNVTSLGGRRGLSWSDVNQGTIQDKLNKEFANKRDRRCGEWQRD
jgi:hypothetical protein